MTGLVRTVPTYGWSIVVDENDEPYVRDLELGERLGFARPRKVRELVDRMLRDGILNASDVRPIVGRTVSRSRVQQLEQQALSKMRLASRVKPSFVRAEPRLRVGIMADWRMTSSEEDD